MDRRNFLRTLIGGVAAGAAVRTFPFRVFSFPSELVAPYGLTVAELRKLIVVCDEEMAKLHIEKMLARERYVYGIAYHNNVSPVDPWLNLKRSPSSFVIAKVDQIRRVITAANA